MLKSHKFTAVDEAIIRSNFALMDCLGTLFGDNCELVLHSFEKLDESVVHIVNGHVTGRKIGAPVTNITFEKLSNFHSSGEMWDVYFSNKNDTKPLKSASLLITNNENVPIGMICINYSLDISINSFVKTFTEIKIKRKKENFSNDVNEMILSHLEPIRDRVYVDKNIPSKNKVSEIISELYDLGLFELSLTTKVVSSELSISSATVYKHLRKISGKS